MIASLVDAWANFGTGVVVCVIAGGVTLLVLASKKGSRR